MEQNSSIASATLILVLSQLVHFVCLIRDHNFFQWVFQKFDLNKKFQAPSISTVLLLVISVSFSQNFHHLQILISSLSDSAAATEYRTVPVRSSLTNLHSLAQAKIHGAVMTNLSSCETDTCNENLKFVQ